MTTAASQDRALEQRRQALPAANRVRSARAAVLSEIRQRCQCEGVTIALTTIRHPSEDVAGIPVEQLFKAIRRFGKVRARSLLFEITDGRVWIGPRICDLNTQQRAVIAEWLESHASKCRAVV